MVKGPPHCGQVVMSMAKTRLSHCAQLMRARVETEESSLFPSARFGTGAASEKFWSTKVLTRIRTLGSNQSLQLFYLFNQRFDPLSPL